MSVEQEPRKPETMIEGQAIIRTWVTKEGSQDLYAWAAAIVDIRSDGMSDMTKYTYVLQIN